MCYERLTVLKTLTLEITNKCHQKCVYCSSDSSLDAEEFISLKKTYDILNDFKKLGGRIVEFSGGEPIAYEFLPEAIEYAKKIGLNVDLFTSAFYKTEFPYRILDYVDRVFLNIQGPNEEIHDYLTDTSGSFQRVISLGKKLKKNHVWVGTHIIPFSNNIDEIDEYLRLAEHLSFENISLLRFVEQGRGREIEEIIKLNEEEILTLHDTIYRLRNSSNVQFKIGCPLDFQFIYTKKLEVIPCSSGISRCVVKSNGKVLPCPALKDVEEFVAGNIYKNTLIEIWRGSPVFKRFRDFDHSLLKGDCNNCTFLSLCKGRCPAQRYHLYNDMYQGPDPYCPLHILRNER